MAANPSAKAAKTATTAKKAGLRVLAPLDGSEQSFVALERGLRLLARLGAPEVTVLNVIHASFKDVPPDVLEAMDLQDEEIHTGLHEARATVDRGAQIAEKFGVTAARKIVQGKPFEEIMKLSAEHDLMIVHSLDVSQAKEVLRGSMTEKIVRNARCDILVVKENLERPDARKKDASLAD